GPALCRRRRPAPAEHQRRWGLVLTGQGCRLAVQARGAGNSGTHSSIRAARIPAKRTGLTRALSAGRNCGGAEAHAGAVTIAKDLVAERGPAVGALVAPAEAPDHAVHAPTLPAIRAPLPDVTVHVVDAQPVRWVRAHFRGAQQVLALGRVAGG